jgi:subtilisin family serine protease
MKKILLLFLLLTVVSFAQSPIEKTSAILKEKLSSSSDDSKLLIWVFFTDKGNNLNKYYSTPQNVVSPLSLKRRAKTHDKSSLVDFSDLQVNNEYITGLQSLGFELNQRSRWFNGVSGYITKKSYNNILSLPYVKYTDIVSLFKKSDEIKEAGGDLNINNPVARPIGVNALNYGASLVQNQQINIPALHNLGFSGQGVTVCMMDAGVSLLSHQAFDSMHIIATYDFVNHRTYIGDDSGGMGEGSHGTMTLSTIGGYVPGQLIGPAYSANFLVTKTENTDSETPVEEDNWVAAMEWADSIGVDVTSTSLGYLTFDLPYTSLTWQNMDGHTAIITLGALEAARKGIIVVNAAGNDSNNVGHNTLIAPADADSIITAGAVTSAGIRSIFSSVGNTVDHRIKPDVMAMGSKVYVADPSISSGESYIYASGTSFSCPLTAGACAVILSYNPNLTNIQIRDALRNTASRHLAPDSLYGWGILNALAAANYFPLTSVLSAKTINPDNFILYQNYPNPFNPSTRIKYFIPVDSKVKIVLFNILGNELKTLFNGNVTSGDHELELSASGLASSVYFVKVIAGGFQKTIKITLTK